jgi:hypothetical protein
MESRKYQGYAQSSGFDPVRVPDTVSRIAREGDRTLRGMRDIQGQQADNQASYINSLERKQSLERQNRDEVFRFNEGQRKRVYEDEMRVLQRQGDVDPGATQSNLKALSQFSETIGKVAFDFAKKKSQEDELYGKNLVFQYGLTPQIMQEYEQNKGKIDKTATTVNGVVNQLEFNGIPIDVLEKFRGLSGRKLYGATVAYAIQGGENYALFRAQNSSTPIPFNGGQITLDGAKSEEEWEAASTFIRTKYLQLYGGVNNALLDEHMFPRMRQSEITQKGAFLKGLYEVKETNVKEEKARDLRSAVASNPGEGLLNYIQREAGYDPTTGKNREWLGPKRAEAFKLLTELAKKRLITSAQVAEMERYEYIHNDGTTRRLGESFDTDFFDLKRAVYEAERSKFEEQEFNEVRTGDQLEEMFLKKQQTEGFSDSELEQAADAYRNATGGRESSVLKNIKSTEKMQDEVARQQLQYLANRNLLTSKELLSGKYSEIVVEGFKTAAKNGDSLGAVDQAAVKKNLDFLNRRARELRGDTSTDKRDSSAQAWVEMEIESIYRQKILSEINKGNRDGALEVASDYVNNLLWSGYKEKKGQFALTDQVKSLNPYVGMGKASSFVEQVNRATGILQRVDADRTYLGREVILRPDELKQLEAFQRGGGSIPSIIMTLAQKNRQLSPVDIINAQLQAARKPLLIPVMSEQVRQGLTPMMRRILEYRPSTANTYQAFSAAPAADPYRPLLDLIASKESTSYGGYDAMNRGGYSAHEPIGSADSKQVFGAGLSQMTVAQVRDLQNRKAVFAAGRYQIIPKTLSGLLAGKYGFTGVNPNDPFNAVTQDKLAVALLRGRAGRFFNNSETLSEAIRGMGNEWSGLEKISPKVLGQHLERAKVALNSQNYWRQADNMRTNVVYKIGSLGYGSTGPHLDLKRVDRGSTQTTGSVRINPTEVDNFVEVQVKGKWKPLSKGTTITDGEDDHRNRSRSSYGIDYAADSGTPVRLKNGATVVGSFKGDQGTDHLIIELPDGRRFQFLHGTIA